MKKLIKKLFGWKRQVASDAQREAFWFSVSTSEPPEKAARRFEEAGKRQA